MKTLVIGGTGTVGSQVMAGLLPLGNEIRCLTRSQAKAATLPGNVTGVVGDTAHPETLPEAMEGADAVVLITALSETETLEGLNAVRVAADTGVRRLVQMSVVQRPGFDDIAHIKSKLPIEEAVAASGLEYTIVRPNCFYQNDLFYQQALMEYGVYPQPIGPIGVSMVDVRDIADAMVNAVTQDGFQGRTITLNGPDALTGDSVAAIWSWHLGQEIGYAGDVDAWGEQAGALMPAWVVEDLQDMFRFFIVDGLRATAEELQEQEPLIGHPPRPYDTFVAETVATWKG